MGLCHTCPVDWHGGLDIDVNMLRFRVIGRGAAIGRQQAAAANFLGSRVRPSAAACLLSASTAVGGHSARAPELTGVASIQEASPLFPHPAQHNLMLWRASGGCFGTSSCNGACSGCAPPIANPPGGTGNQSAVKLPARASRRVGLNWHTFDS